MENNDSLLLQSDDDEDEQDDDDSLWFDNDNDNDYQQENVIKNDNMFLQFDENQKDYTNQTMDSVASYTNWIKKSSPQTNFYEREFSNDEIIYHYRQLLFIDHGCHNFRLSMFTTALPKSIHKNTSTVSRLTGCLKTSDSNEFISNGFFINSQYFVFPKSVYQNLHETSQWKKCIVNFSYSGNFPLCFCVLDHDEPIQEIGNYLVCCKLVTPLSSSHFKNATMPIAPLGYDNMLLTAKYEPPQPSDPKYSEFIYNDENMDANWIYMIGHLVQEDYSDEMKKFCQDWYISQAATKNSKYISYGLALNLTFDEQYPDETVFETDCFLKGCGIPIFNNVRYKKFLLFYQEKQ